MQRRPGGGLSKRAKGVVKDIVHKTSDRSNLSRTTYVPVMPAIKLIPRQSMTLRSKSGLWHTTTGTATRAIVLSALSVSKSFVDFVPKYYQIEEITLYGPRTASYPSSSGDFWEAPEALVSWFGCFTSGTAQEQNLYDSTHVSQMTFSNEGRPKVKYRLSGRDKNFVFDGQSRSTAYPGTPDYQLAVVTMPKDVAFKFYTTFYADVRLTRWDVLEKATSVGVPEQDEMLQLKEAASVGSKREIIVEQD